PPALPHPHRAAAARPALVGRAVRPGVVVLQVAVGVEGAVPLHPLDGSPGVVEELTREADVGLEPADGCEHHEEERRRVDRAVVREVGDWPLHAGVRPDAVLLQDIAGLCVTNRADLLYLASL